ncbi:MAG: DUF927 domain-containing protein [Phascolarctobacterium sp.]|uniref:DUF927 domain-containing protein n=1 Tax=Phascolarctobacterium sp. TaxID=2049039 RepID=UPI0026DADBF0|nr:DUF927 domain-containing protein [Phascolarctobacterium sp.]MDO4920225.1 DUF927 domain-containing protein [Phascolarctobacterium sp.]
MQKKLLTLDDIRPLLEGAKEKANGHIIATCPLCGKAEHLHIDEKDGGQLLVYCQKCSAPGADFFKEWHRLLDDGSAHGQDTYSKAAAKPAPPKATPPKDHGAQIEDYYHVYRMPDGAEVFRKRRRKWADGHKAFSFEFMDGTGNKRYSKPENSNNLYNLDLLEKAAPTDTLYIVEGEKCADAMTGQGFLCTTACTGAQKSIKFTDTDKAALAKFQKLVIIPDNDEKGQSYVEAFAEFRPYILRLPSLWPVCPPKGDIADYFAQGGEAAAVTGAECEAPPALPLELNAETIKGFSAADIIGDGVFTALFAITDQYKRAQIEALLNTRAAELKTARNFAKCLKAYKMTRAQEKRGGHVTQFPEQPLELKLSDKWGGDASGVYCWKQAGDEYVKEYASYTPVMPIKLLHDVEQRTDKIELAFYRYGHWESIITDMNAIASKSKILTLANYGLDVSEGTAKLLIEYLAAVRALNSDTLPRQNIVSRLGWIGGDFVPYSGGYVIDGGSHADLLEAVTLKGSLQAWVDAVKPLQQDIRFRLTLAAAFASVMLEKVDAQPFILHLWGQSGSGKTVSLQIAASVWGHNTLIGSMNATTNAAEHKAAALHNIPVLCDELQTVKTYGQNNYDAVIMRLCEGTGRARLNVEGASRPVTKWHNCFIVTGEETLCKKNSGGGAANRVIEIETGASILPAGVDVGELLATAATNCGNAGKAFVNALQSMELKELQDLCKMSVSIITQTCKTTGKQAAAMGLIYAADCLVSEHIFNNRADILKPEQLKPFVKTLAAVDVAERAKEFIIGHITAHQANFAPVGEKFAPSYTFWGKLLCRNADQQVDGVQIIKQVLDAELAAQGFDLKAVCRRWIENGFMQEGGAQQIRLNGNDRTRVLTLNFRLAI